MKTKVATLIFCLLMVFTSCDRHKNDFYYNMNLRIVSINSGYGFSEEASYNGIENQDRKLKWKFNPNLPEPWKKEQDANSAQTSKRKS